MNDPSEFELLLGYSTLLTCYSGYQWLKERKKKRKRNLLHSTRLDRFDRYSFEYFEDVFLTIKNDPDRCFKYTRMPLGTFNHLVTLLNPYLKVYRSACPKTSTEVRVGLTLSYLAQGVTELFLRWALKVGRSEARSVVAETCEAIWEVLSIEYVAPPNYEEIQSIADDFDTYWNLPNCVGALDSRSFPIEGSPHAHGTRITLVVSCDVQHKFRLADTNTVNDKEKGKLSKFLKCIFLGTFPLPPETRLPNSNVKFPFYFVGDIFFPLKYNLMRPYPDRGIKGTNIFNHRIARGRSLVKNSFGILMARWRVLRSPLNFSPPNAQRVILATVALHNFIKSIHIAEKQYCPPSFVDVEDSSGNIIPGQWRIDVEPNLINTSSQFKKFGSNNTTRMAMDARDRLKDYFTNEGIIAVQCREQKYQ